MQGTKCARYLVAAAVIGCSITACLPGEGSPFCKALAAQQLAELKAEAKAADKVVLTQVLADAEGAGKAALTPYQTAVQELRELGQVAHHIHQASNDLASEVSQPEDMMGEIDIIGGQVIPIMPATAEGFGPTEYLPPRKNYLDLYMNHLANLLPLLNEEINTLAVPDEAKVAVSPMVAKMKTWAGDIQQCYTALQGLTAGPNYANKDIRTQAMSMTESIKGVEKLRRDIYKELRRDEKTAGR
jgi:hypothetical protein